MSAPDAGQRRQALAASPMIRKLRWQFVAACMGLIAAVLAIVFGCVWASAQNALEHSSHMALEQALSRRGGDLLPGFRQNGGDDQVLLPYFTVQVWGTTVYVTGGTYSGLEDTDALTAILTDCLSQEADEGSLPGYALRYLRQDDGLYTQIAFVDISLETAALRQMMASYLRIGLLSLLLLAGASFLLSLRVTRPVERAWRQQRQFFSDASHELKTPLAAIRLLTDSILQTDGIDPATTREFVADIGLEANRLSRITEDLLQLTRLDGDVLPSAAVVDPLPILEQVLRMMELIAEERGIALTYQAEEGCRILGSMDETRQIIYNLVDNAVKYNRDGGRVEVALKRQGEEVLLTVADEGVGIPEEELTKIFQRFYRVDKARSRAAGGTGLGLSIVRDTLEKRGGSISAANRPGGGAVFTVRWPQAEEGGEQA